MPLFEIGESGLEAHRPAQFSELGLRERDDLQRLLRDEIAVLGDDLLVVAEEFGEWEDARRRIDLLAIDKAGRLVVIELKRTEDGGHMELQALRYAAMVSSMVFDDIARSLEKHRPAAEADARADLMAFLEVSEDEEPVISSEVRIILVSADFGRELTTAVLWLNGFEGMDIRCIQLIPYEVGGHVLVDIRQIVPLPEATDYQVKVRRKEQQRERIRTDNRDFTRYHVIVDGVELGAENKRNTMRVMVSKLVEHGVSITELEKLLPSRCFKSVAGEFEDETALKAALIAADSRTDLGRLYVADPFSENGRTWVMTRMWGQETESTLTQLRDSFPQSGITFRRADA